MRDILLSLLMFIAGIAILNPALIIMLVAVLLIVIADELLTREIMYKINGRSSNIQDKQR